MISAANSSSFYMAKPSCHRVQDLVQLQSELNVILAPKKKAACCLKNIDLWDWGNGYINRSTASESWEVTFLLYSALTRSYLQYYVQFWDPNAIDKPEQIQQRPPRLPKLDHPLCGERLSGCSSLQQGVL